MAKAPKGRRHRDDEMATYGRSSHKQHVPRSVRDPIFEEDVQDFQRRRRPVYARLIALMLGIVTLVSGGFGAYFFLASDDIDLQKGKAQHDNFQGIVAMETIMEHTLPEDCWMSIHGKVFDMTEYAPIHPGPPSLITNHCGTDATGAYDVFHAVALLPIVNEYLLGTLEEGLDMSASPTTSSPSAIPSSFPSMLPSTSPPSKSPTTSPSGSPTPSPTFPPSKAPSMRPTTPRPTEPEATPFPTSTPTTPFPTKSPTKRPTPAPTNPPTRPPTSRPTLRPTPPPTEAPQGCAMEFYTMADVAQHPDSGSCWYALYGVVFDFTNYVDRHPGGRRTALAGCGIDSKNAYESERGHNRNLLRGYSNYIIGRVGTTRETRTVPCDEVNLVAVT